MTETQKAVDVLRRIRNQCCRAHCVWCLWVELGSDAVAARCMKAAIDDYDPDGTGIRTSKEVRAMLHQATRRALAEGVAV